MQSDPPVDIEDSGSVRVTVNETTGAVAIRARATGIDDATAAHLHGAFAGASGGVLVGLEQDAGDPGHWFATDGSVEEMDLAQLLAGGTYVNIHTRTWPGGAIVGQALPDGSWITFADLSGAEQVPAPVASMYMGRAGIS